MGAVKAKGAQRMELTRRQAVKALALAPAAALAGCMSAGQGQQGGGTGNAPAPAAAPSGGKGGRERLRCKICGSDVSYVPGSGMYQCPGCGQIPGPFVVSE